MSNLTAFHQGLGHIADLVPSNFVLQRKCNCDPSGDTEDMCPQCKASKHGRLQRSTYRGADVGAVLSIVHDLLATSGRPMETDSRKTMESSFDHDFSNVRLHTDTQATSSDQAVGAKAHTVGNRIVFGNGYYAPNSQAGKHLLAHELPHVLQQKDSNRISRSSISIGVIDDPLAQEAEKVANQVVNDGTSLGIENGIDGSDRSILQREPKKPLIPLPENPLVDSLDIKLEEIPLVGGSVSLEEIRKGVSEITDGKSDDGKSADVGCSSSLGLKPAQSAKFKGMCCFGNENEKNCCPPKLIRLKPGGMGVKCGPVGRESGQPAPEEAPASILEGPGDFPLPSEETVVA